jgi:hypothetical protein
LAGDFAAEKNVMKPKDMACLYTSVCHSMAP